MKKLFFIIACIALYSCKKDNSTSSSSGNNSNNGTNSVSTIYICGGTNSNGDQAKCWVNGTDNLLSNNSSEAKSCFISDNNIFYSGNDFYNNSCVAAYWKNGSVFHLPPSQMPDGCSKGDGLFVENNNVYVTQTSPLGSGYWMNNQFINLSNCQSANAI